MQRSVYRRAFVGRSVGGLALLPTDDHSSPPYLALGCHETPGDSSVYSLPTLELRVETQEMDEGNTEDASATEFVVAAYAEHPGAVTALCAGPPAAPAYVLTGSSQGALGLYPFRAPDGSGGNGGDPAAADAPALGVADPQGGAYGVAAAAWEDSSGGAGGGGGLGGWCTSPTVGVCVTGDGARCAGLRADGALSVHAPELLGNPAVATWQADPVASFGLCWRADGGAVVTVGATGLKLWDAVAVGSGGRAARPSLCISAKDAGRPGATFTCVAAPASGGAHAVAAGTSDGAVVVWDLRMLPPTSAPSHGPGSSGRGRLGAHAVAVRAAHGGLPVRALAFHPKDATALLSGGADGACVLTDLAAAQPPEAANVGFGGFGGFGGLSSSMSGRGGGEGTVLARPSSARGSPAAACMALAFDAAAGYLAAGFDSECVAVVDRHPRLGLGARFN